VERSSQGLQLTGAGGRYLQACAPLLQQFEEAEEQARANTTRTPGTVAVGVQQVIARECLSPALPRFYIRHPEIRLDVYDLNQNEDLGRSGVDVFLVLGWPKSNELVQQCIGAARFVVLASPGYWAAHGMPQRPADLEQHNCLIVRALDHTLMDSWIFERHGVTETVTVRGSMQVSNAHRDMVVDLALAGLGVVRMLDWTIQPLVATGKMQPALSDWTSPEATPVNILFRPSSRRVPRIRKFIDFVREVAEEMIPVPPEMASAQPNWLDRHLGRASVMRKR
jgi:DNA-binding transcriptional LysR family regulator